MGLGLAVVLLVWVSGNRGPRYQGHGVSYWFPRLGNHPLRSEPWQQLTNPAPEVLPLLVAAANQHDHRLARAYQWLHGKLAGNRLGQTLPSLQSAASVQREVAEILVRVPLTRAWSEALTNHYEQFPEFVRQTALRTLANAPQHEEITAPLLLRLLTSTNDTLRYQAARDLLDLPQAGARALPTVVQAFASWPASKWTQDQGWPPQPIALRLAALGPRAGAAMPLLQQWSTSGIPALEASAVVALAAVDPERFPWKSTVLRALPTLGPPEISWILNPRHVDLARTRYDWPPLLEALAPLLELAPTGGARVPGMPAALSTNAHRLLRLTLIDALTLLPTNAPGVAPYLPALLQDTETEKLRTAAAFVLARLGPIAPESIPRLLPGLTNAATAPALVLLLASYGARARVALPELRALAEGNLPLGSARQARASAALAKFYQKQNRPPPPGRNFQMSREIPVSPVMAEMTGLTAYWPLPPEQQRRADLIWSALDPTAPPTEAMVQPVLLSRLAEEAVRHIESAPTAR